MTRLRRLRPCMEHSQDRAHTVALCELGGSWLGCTSLRSDATEDEA